MLSKIFEEYNDDVKKLIGIDYSEATWTKYDRTKRFIKDFIQWKNKTDDIHIVNLNMEFVNDLEIWGKTERKCGQNATMK
ncbi:MAG: phage integrase SAM-like domain-containing protein [Chitinophagaceae bacterium]